jgi:glyoxylase-like metal-dependent hydrolase (beta-lactamase superfamily II)
MNSIFPCFTDTKRNVSTGLFDEPLVLENINPYPAEDEDEIKLGNYIFTVIETPYHTRWRRLLLSRRRPSTLFRRYVISSWHRPRSDLAGFVPLQNQANSLHKLALLPKETKVYPGHGPQTSIGATNLPLIPNSDKPREIHPSI